MRECLNDFCIYQSDERCTLEEISVGTDGTCADMVLVQLDEVYLNAAKIKVRQDLEQALSDIRREFQ